MLILANNASLRSNLRRHFHAGAAIALMAALGPMAPRASAQETIARGAPEAFAGPVDYAGWFAGAGIDTYMRLRHQSQQFGEPDGFTSVTGRLGIPCANGVTFFDAQYNLLNNRNMGFNFGSGVRTMHDTPWGQPRILGFNAYWDGNRSRLGNFFTQFGIGLESLGEGWDARINAYVPTGSHTKLGDDVTITDDPIYFDNFLGRETITRTETALTVVDAEYAARVPDHDIWAYVGAYTLNGPDVSEVGYKFGMRGYIFDDLLLDLSVTDDEVFSTTTTFSVSWFVGRSGPFFSNCYQTMEERLREPVIRNYYTAKVPGRVRGAVALTDEDGQPIRVVHVHSTAAAPGDGTFESPLTSLDDVFGNSQEGDIVLVHSGSLHAFQAARLQDDQRLLGEGGNETHTVVTTELGAINLPATAPGALSGPIPIISLTLGDAITLGEDTAEVSNLQISGVGRGIVSGGGGTGSVNINRMDIVATLSDGIALTALTETVNGVDRARFQITIDDSTFNTVVGDDISLRGTVADPTLPDTEVISITNVRSDNNVNGFGINIEDIDDETGSISIDDYEFNGLAGGGGGIRFHQVDIASTFANPTPISVSNADITDGGASGILVNQSDGTFTFTETNITDVSGAGFRISGGEADTNFTGFISQSVAGAAAVVVDGGHTGTSVFNEETANAGVISATDGTGLQFDNADGSYAFIDKVTLDSTASGGDAGIDILGGSSGTFTFADTDITDAANGAIRIAGSEATVTHNGDVTNNAGNIVAINANSGGVINLNGDYTGTGSGIVVSNNAGGTFNVAGAVDLQTGGNDAVTLTNNTGATTNFTGGIAVDNEAGAGRGLVASGGGELRVAGSNNTISTGTGRAIDMSGVTIHSAGVNLRSVSCDGADLGIRLVNIDGGTFSVGAGGANPGDGGNILNTNGGVFLNNVESASIANLNVDTTNVSEGILVRQSGNRASTVTLAGNRVDGAATNGIAVSATSGGTLDIIVNGNTVTASGAQGMLLSTSAGAALVDASILDNTVINGNTAVAFDVNVGGSSVTTVNLLVDGNGFVNNNAGNILAAEIDASNNANLNATVENNEFLTSQATDEQDLEITSNSGADLRLRFKNNVAPIDGNAQDDYVFSVNGGSFSVEDLGDLDTDNEGEFNVDPAVTNDPGGIPTP